MEREGGNRKTEGEEKKERKRASREDKKVCEKGKDRIRKKEKEG